MARGTSSQLRIGFVIETNGLRTGFQKATRETDKFGRSTTRTSRATSALGTTLRRAAFAAAGAAAAYVSVAQARRAIETTQELALATMGLERNLGMATKEASRWAAVTRARGVDSRTLTMSFTALARNLQSVREGSESSIAVFRSLGITEKQLAATQGNFTKQVGLVADAFGDAEGNATRQAAAQKLLGRGYRDILPMFTEGAKGLQEQLKWADQFGATMGKDTVDAMSDFTTAQRRGRVAIMGLQIAFAKAATPAITEGINALGRLAAVLNDPNLSRSEKIARLRQEFERFRDRVIGIVSDLIPMVAQSAGQIGVELAKGIAKGFMETGLLGKVAIGTLFLRMFGGPRAVLAAGAGIGTMFSGAMAAAASAGDAFAIARGSGYGRINSTRAALGRLTTDAGVATGAMAGLAKQVGIVGAAFIAFEAASGAVKIFSKDAKDLTGSLDQTIGRGNTWQAQIGSLTEKLKGLPGPLEAFGVLNDLAGFTGLKDQGKAAEDLKNALQEIGGADRGRFGILREVIARRAAELNLTERQRKEIEKIVNASRIGRKEAQSARLDRNAQTISSGVFVDGDLERAVDQQLSRINRLYSRWTPQWRKHVGDTFRAQIQATRQANTEGGRLTEQGQRRIRAIIQRYRSTIAKSDPIGIARGVVNGWRRAGQVNEGGIRRFLNRLNRMTPAARRQAASTMIGYARELERKGKLPEGTVERLRSRLTLKFGPRLWNQIQRSLSSGWKGVDSTFRRGSKAAGDDMASLERRTRKHARNVKNSIDSIPGPVRTAYSKLGSYANQAARAFGSNQQVSLRFRGGGAVSGGSRQLVPAAVSPGELISYRGREIYVPGRPEPRDSVLMNLPVGAKVFTFDGQARLASGASQSEALRKQVPHFATGGMVGADIPRPKLTGGARVPRATGQAAIDRGRKQAQSWVERLKPTLKGLERLAAKFGLQTTSGYRPGDDGYHGVNRARDFSNGSGPTPQMLKFARYVGGNFGRQLLELIYTPLGWGIKNGARVAPYARADHYDHVHVALRKGGRVKAPWLRRYKRWGPDMLTTLAYYVGLPNPSLMGRIAMGESGGNPRVSNRNTNGTIDRGLWQINSVHGYTGNHYDPLTNAIMAKRVHNKQGVGAWYAPPTGRGGSISERFLNIIHYSPAQRKSARRRARAADRRLGKLRRQNRQRGTKASRSLARRAGKAVRRAKRAAKQLDAGRARRAAKRANRLISRGNDALAPKGNGSNRPGGSGSRPSRPSLTGTKAVDELLALARRRGISLETRESLLSNALSVAQGTETTEDDLRVLGRQRTFQQNARARARRRLAQANRMLSKKGLSKKQRAKWKRIRNEALQALGQAASEITSIDDQIEDARGGGESATDLAQAMKELADAINEQNRLQSSVQATSSREALRMLSDVISGEIVGRRSPVAQTPTAGVRY